MFVMWFSIFLIPCSWAAATTKPNILHILVDDLGYADLGYKNKIYETPTIDALALNGVRIPNYYTFTVCAPSRASIMTGRYPWGVGYYWVGGDFEGVNSSYAMLPKLLKQGGYDTVAVGKWHCGAILKEHTPTYRGFDSFFGYYHAATESYWYHGGEGGGCAAVDFSNNTGTHIQGAENMAGVYSTHAFTDYAVDRIKRHDASKPLYMYLSHQVAHDASGAAGGIQAPKETVDLYGHVADDAYKVQAASVTELDWGVKKVMQALTDKGMWDTTVVVVTSDNGGPLGHALNTPLRGGKHSYWEGGIRAEAFVYSKLLPKSVQGSVWDGLVHSSDWYTTMVEGIAGQTIPDDTGPRAPDGFNLWSALQSGGEGPRTEVITQVQNEYSKGHDPMYCGVIRSGDFKLIIGKPAHGNNNNDVVPFPSPSSSTVKFGTSGTGTIESNTDHATAKATKIKGSGKYDTWCEKTPCLFNVKDDPSESNDLAGQASSAAVIKKLTQRLKEAAATGPPFAATFEGSHAGAQKKEATSKICSFAKNYGFVQPYDWSGSGPAPPPSPPSPPSPPGPSPPAPAATCAKALANSCPLAKYKSYDDCLKCTRAISTDVCLPKVRKAYCHQISDELVV